MCSGVLSYSSPHQVHLRPFHHGPHKEQFCVICIFTKVGQPVRFALLVLVYHVMKTLVVIKICADREQIKAAVCHIRENL